MSSRAINRALRIAAGCAMALVGAALAAYTLCLALHLPLPAAQHHAALLGLTSTQRLIGATMLMALSIALMLSGLHIAFAWPRSRAPRRWATTIWAIASLCLLATIVLNLRGIAIARSFDKLHPLLELDSLQRHIFVGPLPSSSQASDAQLLPHLRIERYEGTWPALEVVKSAHGSTGMGAWLRAARIDFEHQATDTTLLIAAQLEPHDVPWHQPDVALRLLLPVGYSLRIDTALVRVLEPLQPLCPNRWPNEMVGRRLVLMRSGELIEYQHKSN